MRIFLSLLTLFFATLSFADTFVSCGAGTYVYVGDTQATVLSKCGKPTSETQSTAPTQITQKRVRWVYNQNTIANVTGAVVGTQGVPITVEFIDSKVSKITVAGETYNSFNHCGVLQGVTRPSIKVGDDMNRVQAICGPPLFTNTDQAIEQGPTVETTQYNYVFSPLLPPTIITLQNGLVTAVQ